MGGYPVHIDGSGVRLRLPDGITEEKAIDLNERAGQHDGIERIDPNGTVHFRDDTVRIMQEVLGFNPNRKIFQARKRETAALGAGEKLVLGHPLAATIGDSARCMQNLEKVLFTGPKTSDTVTFICD